MAPKPLSGVRVIDLTNVLAGPFCCHQLAHMGADVIKVEAPGRGDLARQLGADTDLSAANMGVSFLAQNAGKRSVTLNLKHRKGKELLKSLVKSADILVENFRPGVMDRLSLSYDTLAQENESLIYCAISGFGQNGPWVQHPAYDQIIQGLSGVMSITGDQQSAPLRVGYPIADTIGGLTAAFAISAALNTQPRGTFIDVSMLEATLSTMGWVVSNFLIGDLRPAPHGNENVTSAPSGAFQAKDGLLNISANKDEQWVSLARHIGREDLLERPEFASRELRKENRASLNAELEKALVVKQASVWANELNQLGVPAGAVMTVPDILNHPQVRERGFVRDYETVPGIDKTISVATTGFTMDGNRPQVEGPPPQLGRDNDEIWGALGYSADDIAAFKEDGVI
ncbi:MAG: CoA transferase [Pseudomonadota bacterium]